MNISKISLEDYNIFQWYGMPLKQVHHLNDDNNLPIALLAPAVRIELVSSSARVTSAKFQPKLSEIERPRPRDT